jgi:Complex 1 protein (LYR family)
MRLSGLQRDVLKLYRQCLREARKKPPVCTFKNICTVPNGQLQTTRPHFEAAARQAHPRVILESHLILLQA